MMMDFAAEDVSTPQSSSVDEAYSENGDGDLETRIDRWLTFRGIVRDDPSSKKSAYFSAKRSKISSVIKSECRRSVGLCGSPLKREFDFTDASDQPQNLTFMELDSPVFEKQGNNFLSMSSIDTEGRLRAVSMTNMIPGTQSSTLLARRLANKTTSLKIELQEIQMFSPESKASQRLSVDGVLADL